jgi:hypothetical protein
MGGGGGGWGGEAGPSAAVAFSESRRFMAAVSGAVDIVPATALVAVEMYKAARLRRWSFDRTLVKRGATLTCIRLREHFSVQSRNLLH